MPDKAEIIIKNQLKKAIESSSFNQKFYEFIEVVSTQDYLLVFKLPVRAEYCSRFGSLHSGGLTALIDGCTAIASRVATGEQKYTLSVSLHVSITELPRKGEQITIQTKCLSIHEHRVQTVAIVLVGDQPVALAIQDFILMRRFNPLL